MSPAADKSRHRVLPVAEGVRGPAAGQAAGLPGGALQPGLGRALRVGDDLVQAPQRGRLLAAIGVHPAGRPAGISLVPVTGRPKRAAGRQFLCRVQVEVGDGQARPGQRLAAPAAVIAARDGADRLDAAPARLHPDELRQPAQQPVGQGRLAGGRPGQRGQVVGLVGRRGRRGLAGPVAGPDLRLGQLAAVPGVCAAAPARPLRARARRRTRGWCPAAGTARAGPRSGPR